MYIFVFISDTEIISVLSWPYKLIAGQESHMDFQVGKEKKIMSTCNIIS